ncbi:hypothetical protein S1361_22250 [Streptomyces cyanogenus]|uniref:Uncharacterized protein n=1 Tax=Streptomyces cyanogenus TaxID=80860 RepID=A0ABX7TTK0_STRCY|nr:hypothetical protein S1361_22250 [Streptomyces cyanogenus]
MPGVGRPGGWVLSALCRVVDGGRCGSCSAGRESGQPGGWVPSALCPVVDGGRCGNCSARAGGWSAGAGGLPSASVAWLGGASGREAGRPSLPLSGSGRCRCGSCSAGRESGQPGGWVPSALCPVVDGGRCGSCSAGAGIRSARGIGACQPLVGGWPDAGAGGAWAAAGGVWARRRRLWAGEPFGRAGRAARPHTEPIPQAARSAGVPPPRASRFLRGPTPQASRPAGGLLRGAPAAGAPGGSAMSPGVVPCGEACQGAGSAGWGARRGSWDARRCSQSSTRRS